MDDLEVKQEPCDETMDHVADSEKCNLMESLQLVYRSPGEELPLKRNYNLRLATRVAGALSRRLSEQHKEEVRPEPRKQSELQQRDEVERKRWRRRELSGIELLEWRQREADRVRQRRANYTPEQRTAWRKRAAELARLRRKRFTIDQLQLWRSKNAAYSRARRASLTEEQLQDRRKRSRERARRRRANQSEEQRLAEKKRHLERKRQRALALSQKQTTNTPHVEQKQTRTPLTKTCICLVCRESLPTRKSLRRHVLKQHGLNIPFPCGLCWRAFRKRSELARHRIQLHQLQDTYTCNICGKESAEMQKMFNHGRTHLNHRSIYRAVPQDGHEICICKICQIIFVKKEMYDAHIEWDHKGNMVVPLQLDSYDLKDISKRKSHICEFCGEILSHKSKLRVHVMLNHPGEVSHSNKHLIKNKSVRPKYVCNFCGENFDLKCNLSAHYQMNHKNKIHEELVICTENKCSPQSEYEDNLHIIVESVDSGNERDTIDPSHVCVFCGVAFGCERNLKSHFNKQHPELLIETSSNKVYKTEWDSNIQIMADREIDSSEEKNSKGSDCEQCFFCGETFKQKVHLHNHFLTVHSELAAVDNIAENVGRENFDLNFEDELD